MMAKVIGLLARQYLEAAEVPSLRELIDDPNSPGKYRGDQVAA